MIKMYCDGCGKEIKKNMVDERLEDHISKRTKEQKDDGQQRTEIGIQVTVAVNKTWNSGHVCIDCLEYALRAACDAERGIQTGEV